MKKISLNFKTNKSSPFFWIKVAAFINFLALISMVTTLITGLYMNHQIDQLQNGFIITMLMMPVLPLFYFILFHFLPENKKSLQIMKYLFLFQIPAFNFNFIAYKLGLILPIFITFERQIINSVKTNLAFNLSWTTFDFWFTVANEPFSFDGIGINIFALAIFLLTTYKLKKTRR